jgi:hypothetical protein
MQPPAPLLARSRYWYWLRALLGISILAAICAWVIREGSFWRLITAETLVWSAILSLAIGLLQGLTLKAIARACGRSVDLGRALQITALGTLGNNVGGLPIGTALKVAILRDSVGLTLGQITGGLAAFTVGTSLWLLVGASLAILPLDLAPGIKTVPALLLLVATALVIVLVRVARQPRFAATLRPLTQPESLAAIGGLSLAIAALFILNSCVVGLALLPGHDIAALAFLSASGTLVGLATLIQSIGGVLEIAMALMARTIGANPVEGAQIALVLRGTGVASSLVILALRFASQSVRKRNDARVLE